MGRTAFCIMTDHSKLTMNATDPQWQTVYLLCTAVGTDNVLNLIGVWILKAQAAHAEPHPVMVLGTKTIHYRNRLAFQLQH